MANLSKAQQDVLAFAREHGDFYITGPWQRGLLGGSLDGIETVTVIPYFAWLLRRNWRAPIKRLVRKGLLIKKGDIYSATPADGGKG